MADAERTPPLRAVPLPARPDTMTVDEVATALRVDAAVGLDPAEADRRRATHGPNAIEAERRAGVLPAIVEAATEPFILLLAAAGIGAVLLGEVRDGLLILAALVPIVGADVVTEVRAERALEALRRASAPTARVRRAGAVAELPALDLVPGDVVLVRAGDVLAADVRLTAAEALVLDRSALTGESVPEPATVAPDPVDASLADRRSVAYAGAGVVAGRGEGIVVATGRRTEVGRIAASLAEAAGRRRSPLQRELDRLVRIALVVAIGLIATVTGLGFLRGQEAGANLLAGISAAIAAIPEEPPILLAVILGLGAYRLLRRGVLVRRLNAQEVLGAVDLVVTDKTGTLTENRLEVASVAGSRGPIDDPGERRAILESALRAEDDAWAREGGAALGSFSGALVRAIDAAGGDAALDSADLVAATPIADGRPFASARFRTAGGGEREVALGAPEDVLGLCDPAAAAVWATEIAAGTERGERALLLAERADEGAWRPLALVGFADALRDGIGDAFAEVRGAGIQVIVVTGDHPATAAAIARSAGLDGDHVVLGRDLEGWDDARLAAELGRLQVVARSTPADKRRIVAVARRSGRIVAVTGDGVNDAPALNGADVGVAMGSGTAVAKEAADLVLGDDSFLTLVDALREGRRMVDNVRKGLVFLISTHVALLGFVLVATLAGFAQPLLPIQILWLELFIDVSTSIAFEREPAEPDLMERPPRKAGAPLLPFGLLGRIVVAGGISALAGLALILVATGGPGDPQTLDRGRWLAFTALVGAQVVRAYANRSLHLPLHRIGRNGFLLALGVLVIAIQATIPAIPPLADAFRAVPLGPLEWLVVAVVALAPALFAEAVRTIRPRTWVA